MRSLSSNQYVIRQGKLVLKSKDSNAPAATSKNNKQISSNCRYIPYEHTVRRVLMQDYYDNTISQQKRQIQEIKDKYQRLLEESHNGMMEIPRDKIERIQQALADNSSSQIRVLRAADITLPIGNQAAVRVQDQLEDSRCSKRHKGFVSELVFSRQIVDDRVDLTPTVISRSILFRKDDDCGEQPLANSHILIPCQEQYRKIESCKKGKREAKTKQTEESDLTIRSVSKELKDLDEDQIVIQRYQRPQHHKTASIILQHNPESNQWQECHSYSREQDQVNPLTERLQNSNRFQADKPEDRSESRIAFQQLLRKTIEEHEDLKELFQLYKVSSEDRITELERNFQEDLEEIELKCRQEKENSDNSSKKVKKLKKELKGKDDVILDLIQKLRAFIKDNEQIKSEYRTKAALSILELMKQKQFSELAKAKGQGNSQNVILSAVALLSQCRKQREIKKNLQSSRSLQVVNQ